MRGPALSVRSGRAAFPWLPCETLIFRSFLLEPGGHAGELDDCELQRGRNDMWEEGRAHTHSLAYVLNTCARARASVLTH